MNNVEAGAWPGSLSLSEKGHGRRRSGGAVVGTVDLVVIHARIFGVAPRPPPDPLRGIAEQDPDRRRFNSETGHGRGRSCGAEVGTVALVVIHALIFGVAPRPPPAPLVSTGSSVSSSSMFMVKSNSLGVVCEGTESF